MTPSNRLSLTVALAVGLGVLGVVLLPRVSQDVAGDPASGLSYGRAAGTPKAVFVPGLSTGEGLLVRSGAAVQEGDTLAFRQNDPYGALREQLDGLARGTTSVDAVLETQNALGSSGGLLDTIARTLRALPSATDEVQRPRYTSAGSFDADPELIAAEIMGAEDAIRELTDRLRQLSPPSGPDAQQQAVALAQEISVKQAFLADASRRKRLAAAPKPAARRSSAPRLTRRQQSRVRAFSRRLKADTSYVYAPATGLLILSDQAGQSRIMTRDANGSVGDASGADGYVLQPVGLPVLWSRAARSDSVAAVPVPNAIVVQPQ